jgi:hypothetical protein
VGRFEALDAFSSARLKSVEIDTSIIYENRMDSRLVCLNMFKSNDLAACKVRTVSKRRISLSLEHIPFLCSAHIRVLKTNGRKDSSIYVVIAYAKRKTRAISSSSTSKRHGTDEFNLNHYRDSDTNFIVTCLYRKISSQSLQIVQLWLPTAFAHML